MSSDCSTFSNKFDSLASIISHSSSSTYWISKEGAQNALGTTSTGDYEIHDEMSIKKTSLKELYSSTETKRRLTKYFAEGLLLEYKDDPFHTVIVSYETTIAINEPHSLPDTLTSHRHEEADTQIPLHILFSIEVNPLARIALRCVFSRY